MGKINKTEPALHIFDVNNKKIEDLKTEIFNILQKEVEIEIIPEDKNVSDLHVRGFSEEERDTLLQNLSTKYTVASS